MDRQEIYCQIEEERAYQIEKFGHAFDDKNTINDWIAYVVKYLGNAATTAGTFAGDPVTDQPLFRKAILKVATLCVAILERDTYAKRHYDE
jgi:hypothetical protein